MRTGGGRRRADERLIGEQLRLRLTGGEPLLGLEEFFAQSGTERVERGTELQELHMKILHLGAVERFQMECRRTIAKDTRPAQIGHSQILCGKQILHREHTIRCCAGVRNCDSRRRTARFLVRLSCFACRRFGKATLHLLCG